jgi:hypothetical protein
VTDHYRTPPWQVGYEYERQLPLTPTHCWCGKPRANKGSLRGWCSTHQYRWQTWNSPHVDHALLLPPGLCRT